tara:strand:- start:8743 stop:9003 length:261 start_codon:yes stop_codon:yes gene_type:complete
MANKGNVPTYYIGKHKKIKAHEVIADYELSYNVGTAVTYLLRSGKKPNNPAEQDIQKAIDHLQFELTKIKNNNTNNLFDENTHYSY